MAPPPSATTRVQEDGTFEFLSRSKASARRTIDWASSEMPLLWRDHLHYFQYACDERLSADWLAATIDDWIARNPIGALPAWAPYVASVRAASWVKLLARRPHLGSDRMLASLYRHGLWIERNLERHILANHYLKNAHALVLLGAFFTGSDAVSWSRRGGSIFGRELVAQFLDDGGHVERSPMYHSIVVEDLLDVVNVAAHTPNALDLDLVERARRTAIEGLGFLAAIRMPDREIPLFNDSAFGIAQPPEALFAYAERLLGWQAPPLGIREVRALASSGYFVIRENEDVLIVDCGEMGPVYQPAHAHADALSYELALGGRRVVVDTGVVGYESTQERRELRGTRAHNTVVVDGVDQAELWGVFRAGRRARPLDVRLERSANSARFSGGHDGYRRLGDGIVHRRTIDYDDGVWRIHDDVEGRGVHRVESLLHLHPDLVVTREPGSLRIHERAGRPVATVVLDEDLIVGTEPSMYYPRFGVRYPNVCVSLALRGPLPLRLTYVIVPARHGASAAADGAESTRYT